MASTYSQDTRVRLAANFKTTAGVDADPTTIKVKIKPPTGVVATYVYVTDTDVVRASAGNYHIDVTADKPGRWVYRWEGSGAVQVTGESYFDVLAPGA